MLKKSTFLCVLLFLQCLYGVQAYEYKLYPDSVTQWKAWILDKYPQRNCMNVELSVHVCALPSILNVDMKLKKGTFEQRWDVLAKTLVPVPHFKGLTPVSVKSEKGKSHIIQFIGGRPYVELDEGVTTLKGSYTWSEMPSVLMAPDYTARVAIKVMGESQEIDFVPETGIIELSARNEKQTSESGSSVTSFDYQVYRKFGDKKGFTQELFVVLDYSGPAQQLTLDLGVTDDFELTHLESELELFENAKGDTVVAIKPGRWQLSLTFYSHSSEVVYLPVVTQSLASEVWVFDIAPEQTTLLLDGLTSVSTNLLDIPASWKALDAYTPSANAKVSLTAIVPQGKLTEQQLSLSHQVWLGATDQKWVNVYQITGSSEHEVLKLESGKIERAYQKRQLAPVIETGTDLPGYGVVVPDIRKDIEVVSTKELPSLWQVAYALNMQDWDINFTDVSLSVYLPQGWLLIATDLLSPGTGSLLESIRVPDIFYVLVLFLLAKVVWGAGRAAMLACFVLLTLSMSSAPHYIWLIVLVLTFMRQYIEHGILKRLITSAWLLSIVILFATSTHFIYQQCKFSMFPSVISQDEFTSDAQFIKRDGVLSMYSDKSLMPSRLESKRSYASVPVVKAKPIERLPLTLNIGRDIPTWGEGAMTYYFAKGNYPQHVTLYVLNPILAATMRMLIVGLLIALLFKECLRFKARFAELRQQVSVSSAQVMSNTLKVCLLFAVMCGGLAKAPDVLAMPSDALLQEYEKRLLEEGGQCADTTCAAVTKSYLQIDNYNLYVELTVHVTKDGLFPLPMSKQWAPSRILVNNKKAISYIRQGGRVYLALSKGVKKISLTGGAQGMSAFALHFDYPLRNLNVDAKDWELVNQGVSENQATFYFEHHDRKQVVTENVAPIDISPQFYVYRELTLSDKWYVTTRINRINQSEKNFTLTLPALQHEILSKQRKDVSIDKNEITINFSSGETSLVFKSVVSPQDKLQLSGYDAGLLEYKVRNTPFWEIKLADNAHHLVEKKSDWLYNWVTYDVENVQFDVAPRQFWSSQNIAVDHVDLHTKLDASMVSTDLTLVVNSLGYQGFELDVPSAYKIETLELNGIKQATPGGQKFSVKLVNGENRIRLVLESQCVQFSYTVPSITASETLYNIDAKVDLGGQYWLLFGGDRSAGISAGVAFTFIMALLCLLVLRASSLVELSWLQLAVFSVSSLFLPVSIWLGLVATVIFCQWYAYFRSIFYRAGKRVFNFVQFCGLAFGVLWLVVLSLFVYLPLTDIPQQITLPAIGAYSDLTWFFDVSGKALPDLTLLLLPNWLYKVVLMVWAIGVVLVMIRVVGKLVKLLAREGVWYRPKEIEHPQLVFEEVDKGNE